MDHPSSAMSTVNASDGLLVETKKYSDSVRAAALAIGISVIIFGFLGNLITIIAVIKTKALRTGANIFIISLSVFDMMFVTMILPTLLTAYWNNAWVLGKAYCNINVIVGTLAIGGNVMSLSGTAVSRYLKIINPKASSLIFGRKLYTAILVCSFLSVPVLLLLPAITGVWGTFGYNPHTIDCTFLNDNSGYAPFMMACCIIIPIMFISFCYLRILCKVCSNRRKIQAARNGNGHQQQSTMREDLRYTGMMVFIFAVLLLSYAPYFINILMDPYAEDMTMRFVTMALYWPSSCVNPVLYGLMNRNFRHAFVNIYKQVKELTSVARSEALTNDTDA